ncbi:MAG TPA: histidine triad nucleotide-binding protein, partial [Firmicutes bacterium]|nr:histidine triad nucleotide-binding protein [Bacillota bacterium]
MNDCLFCKIAAGEIEADILYKDDQILVLKDIRPQAPVHLLVLPVEHHANLGEAAEKAPALLTALLTK